MNPYGLRIALLAAGSGEWAVPGSNQRPPACKAGALPTELTALGPSLPAQPCRFERTQDHHRPAGWVPVSRLARNALCGVFERKRHTARYLLPRRHARRLVLQSDQEGAAYGADHESRAGTAVEGDAETPEAAGAVPERADR